VADNYFKPEIEIPACLHMRNDKYRMNRRIQSKFRSIGRFNFYSLLLPIRARIKINFGPVII